MFEITTIATPQTAATVGMPTSAWFTTARAADVRDRHVALDVRDAVAPVAPGAAALVKGGAAVGTPAWSPPNS